METVFPVNFPAHPVASLAGGPGQQGGQARRLYPLETSPGGEEHAAAAIHAHQHRTFPFLAEHLGMGFAGTGGDPPVDVAHVIPRLVRAGLVEFHAPAAHARDVLAALAGANHPGAQLQLACLVTQGHQFTQPDRDGRDIHGFCHSHQGTGTRATNSEMKRSGVTPSASAS